MPASPRKFSEGTCSGYNAPWPVILYPGCALDLPGGFLKSPPLSVPHPTLIEPNPLEWSLGVARVENY